jgi:hypothetical protein
MLFFLFLSYIGQLFLSLFMSKIIDYDGSISKWAFTVANILVQFAFVMQIFFIVEMKRVRIYVESRTPLELQLAARKFRNHKILMTVLVGSMWISFTIAAFVIKDAKNENGGNKSNYMTPKAFTYIILAGFIFLTTFMFLLGTTFQQYHFFISKKKSDVAS